MYFLLLSLDKGKDNDSEDQIHKEKLTHNDHQVHKDGSKDWKVDIHEHFLMLVPSIAIDDQEHCE